MQEGSRRAVITAFVANLAIAVSKFVAWTMTGAASMLAEAVHSLADTSNQALLLFGSSRATREATEEHPFGYGRERYFWAFVVAVVLFTLGSLFAIYEGFQKLRHPHELTSPMWAIGVLLVAMVFEAYAFRTALHEANQVRRGTWLQFIRRAKAPELPVILLEDFGALVGLLFALAGVGLTLLTGDARFDAVGSLAIGGLLGVIAVVLAVEMKSLLIGESAAPHEQAAIRDAIERSPEVSRLIHLRTLHLGPDEVLVAMKIALSGDPELREIADSVDAIEARVRAGVPAKQIAIYVEPDVYRPHKDPSRNPGDGPGSSGQA